MESETWRSVVGYEGLYEVSSEGRVRSLPRDRVLHHGGIQRLRGKTLAAHPERGGYLNVTLLRDGHRHTAKVHHLVLEAFDKPRPSGCDGAHDDGNPANNRVNNLVWKTRPENEQDKRVHGTYHLSGGRRAGIPKRRNEIHAN